MSETLLTIQNQTYPFESRLAKAKPVRVEERQVFSLLTDLLEKKGEMQKKSKLAESPYLIKLLKIYQENLTLHYIYEFVPFPLADFIPTRFHSRPLDARAFLKKLAFELTMLISCLATLRIELDLSLANLGLTDDEKLKVFMGARCRMGHKTEVSLIAHYGACKERVLSFLEAQAAREGKPSETPNFVIKGNKLVFPSRDLNESIYEHCYEQGSVNDSACQSNVFDSNIYSGANISTASCINPNFHDNSAKLRQTQSPRFGRNFNFSEARDHRSASKYGKSHKNSFQFGARKGREKYYTEFEDDNSDAKSFTHSRSIRIEFEQKFDPNARKKRKDSCKLKITTFHEYEMDDVNPQELFRNSPKADEDLFDHFAKRDHERRERAEEPLSDLFSKKQAPPEQAQTTSASSTRNNLEEKVRLAREKAENLLSRFLHAKKNTLHK